MGEFTKGWSGRFWSWVKAPYVDFLGYFWLHLGDRWHFLGVDFYLEEDEFYVVVGKVNGINRYTCVRSEMIARRYSMIIPCKTFAYLYVPLEMDESTIKIIKSKRITTWVENTKSVYVLTPEETAEAIFKLQYFQPLEIFHLEK